MTDTNVWMLQGLDRSHFPLKFLQTFTFLLVQSSEGFTGVPCCDRGRLQRAKIQFREGLSGEEAPQPTAKMLFSFPKRHSCDAKAERTPRARHILMMSGHSPPRPRRAPMGTRKALTEGAPPALLQPFPPFSSPVGFLKPAPCCCKPALLLGCSWEGRTRCKIYPLWGEKGKIPSLSPFTWSLGLERWRFNMDKSSGALGH